MAMNKEDKQKLEQELKSNYNGYDVRIALKGIVTLSLNIKNLKSFVNGNRILLSDEQFTEMDISSFLISTVEVTEENILISMIKGRKIMLEKIKEGKKIEDNRKRTKRKDKSF